MFEARCPMIRYAHPWLSAATLALFLPALAPAQVDPDADGA